MFAGGSTANDDINASFALARLSWSTGCGVKSRSTTSTLPSPYGFFTVTGASSAAFTVCASAATAGSGGVAAASLALPFMSSATVCNFIKSPRKCSRAPASVPTLCIPPTRRLTRLGTIAASLRRSSVVGIGSTLQTS
jgi:hypothetical protein